MFAKKYLYGVLAPVLLLTHAPTPPPLGGGCAVGET